MGRLSFSISMRRANGFGSKRRKRRFTLEAQRAKGGWIGFSSTTMARIYSLGDATVDLLGVMRLESVMETDRRSKDQGDSLRRVRECDG